MKKYKANATVLGLTTGETFESDDQFYADISTSGIIEEVKDDGEISGGLPKLSDEGGSEESGGSGAAGSGAKGRGKS